MLTLTPLLPSFPGEPFIPGGPSSPSLPWTPRGPEGPSVPLEDTCICQNLLLDLAISRLFAAWFNKKRVQLTGGPLVPDAPVAPDFPFKP